MPPLENCDEIIDGIRDRLGRHALSTRKIFPVALSRDPYGAIVEFDDAEGYAVIYYWQKKGERWLEKPRVVMLPDLKAVQTLIDEDDRLWCEKYKERAQPVTTVQRPPSGASATPRFRFHV